MTVSDRSPQDVALSPNAHVHFMGICGTAMASLAGIMKQKGYKVTGSDQNVYPPMSTQLERLNIPIQLGYRAENLSPRPDLVIVGNVISRINPEAQALLASDIPFMSLPQAIGSKVIDQRHSVVISGTHGKTTTTSMMAHTLNAFHPGLGYLIGGIPKNFGQSFSAPANDWFVIEGDEYDTAFFDKVPKFIHYRPQFAVFTSCEFDHADIYNSIDDIKKSFRRLIDLVPQNGMLIYCVDDANVRELSQTCQSPKVSYGIQSGDYQARQITTHAQGCSFDVNYKGKPLISIEMQSYGNHNVLNALSVIALCHEQKLDLKKVAEQLKTFSGVKRRQEILGEPRGIRVIEDFAHHPTAVDVTVQSVRKKFPEGRLISVFEPRSATSRRKVFQQDYARAFNDSDYVFIAQAFDQAKIDEKERFSSEELVSDLNHQSQRAEVGTDVEKIVERLAQIAQPKDTILIMSNGGFDGIYQKLLTRLEV